MTVTEKKNEIARIKNIVNTAPGHKPSIQFTSVSIEGPFLIVNHTASKDDKSIEAVDQRLVELGFPTTGKLKEMFEVMKESGDGSVYYDLKVRMKSIDRNKITQLRSRKLNNIPNNVKFN